MMLKAPLMKNSVEVPELPPFKGAPYSQIVRCGDWLFTSGQVATDPETQTLREPDITVQTRQVMRNLASLLEAANSGLDNVVSARIYLADLSDWQEMNAVYREYVGTIPPTRAAIQVGLPEGVLVEIEVIAHA